MPNQMLIISPEYTKYSDYDEDSLLSSAVDTFSLKIRGCVDIDGVDETITTYFDRKTLESNYELMTKYKFIYRASLKIHLYRKYHGYKCQVTYKYTFNYLNVQNKHFTLDITDGENHPRVQLCGKNAISYKCANIIYIGKGSTFRNLKRNLRGVFLPNYVSLRKITPY